MHWCANLVCSVAGLASAVLLRALEPVDGLEIMRRRRGGVETGSSARDRESCVRRSGFTRDSTAQNARGGSVVGAPTTESEKLQVAVTPRIGITKAADWPLRFCVAGSPWISRKETGGGSRDPPPGKRGKKSLVAAAAGSFARVAQTEPQAGSQAYGSFPCRNYPS